MLREGHCKRNQSCIRGRKYGKVLNLNNIVHIRVIFARFSLERELHANANETCVRDMQICARIEQFFSNLSGGSNSSSCILCF